MKPEKPLKIVIRGIPLEAKVEEVREDLAIPNYPATKVVRMRGKNEPAPLTLTEIGKGYKSIYDTKHC